ncbi:hypothetical protein C4D60_Mb09t08800 [Musa balbisiana]|uniref:Uncharacterized protein n=1 Tax=Musa balbisiana TaxID=52838 RepID=A0A4S8IF03_MUSBA|nr:hypothetical protein C4D60_Mb09t08800 [Musa balbisiana]
MDHLCVRCLPPVLVPLCHGGRPEPVDPTKTSLEGVEEEMADELGMGTALETLCGQAVGAGQLHTVGIYMQRSWIIALVAATALIPLYVFTAPILKLQHQPDDTSDVAGRFRIRVIPQLFAYAVNFPLQKFS